jgi:hypothetical protein
VESWRFGANLEIWRFERFRDLENWRFRDLGIWRFGDLEILRFPNFQISKFPDSQLTGLSPGFAAGNAQLPRCDL